jgi:superfamily I DNA/RNA helicase
MVTLLERLLNGEEIDEAKLKPLLLVTGHTVAEITSSSVGEEDEQEDEDEEEPESEKPSITVTSLLGSKGLQAGYVFIVGVNEKHFPYSNTKITDDEICKLIVALTRTRKACHLISTGRFGAEALRTSQFTEWLKPLSKEIYVDKSYFEKKA